ALTAEHRRLVEHIEQLREEDGRQRARITALSARYALESAAIQETEHRLTDLRQAVQKIQSEAERLLERREQMGAQIRDLGEEETRLAGEIGALGERRHALGREREDKLHGLGEARARHGAQAARLGELEALLGNARAALDERRERHEGVRAEQMRAAGSRADLTRAAGALRERAPRVGPRRERLRDELEGARAESERLAETRTGLEARRHQTGVQLSLLGAELAETERQRAEKEDTRSRTREALAELRVSLAATESARAALERLERAREGYGAGVRAIFSEGGAQLSGIVGTVADLLDVPSDLELAVEAVLGDRLQWVVVERFEHARAALGYLGREGAGAATLLPLETLPPAAHALSESAEVTWAARVVGGRPELLGYLLGRVGVVPHLDQAETLWRRNGVVAPYVTPSGEVLSPTGRLSGGRRDSERHGNDQSILGRKRAIRELDEVLAGRRQEIEAASGRLDRLEADVADLRAREAMLRSNRQAQEAVRLAGEKDVESLVREAERVRRHLETLAVEEEQIEAERAEAVAHLADVERELAVAQVREGALDHELSEIGAALAADREAESVLVADVTACRVDLATVSERVEAL